MESNLDKNFKDAFEDFELSYNSKSWDSLKEKLDQIQPVDTIPNATKPSNLKWIFGAAAAVFVIGTVAYYMQQKSTQQPEETNLASKTEVSNGNQGENNVNAATSTSSQKTNENKNSSENHTNKENVSATTTNVPNTHSPNKTTELKEQHKQTGGTTEYSVSKNGSGTHYSTTENKTTATTFNNSSNGESNKGDADKNDIIFPEMETLICENNSVSISNKNNSELIVLAPSGKETVIVANKTINYSVSESGTYSIYSAKNPKSKSQFNVKESPRLDFLVDDELKYDNGIPSIPVETYSEGNNFEWSFEGNATKQYGDKAVAHFYKKGTHEITLTQKYGPSCKVSTSKSVTIDEDYNLMAPSGFMPQSTDSRKNKFIPFALTLRNTGFKLFIIEPMTGNVIFETNSLEGWDGIDRNTRQLVEENKSFAWKVILANPEPDERKEYSGIVVRL
jgi:hypothetical protein